MACGSRSSSRSSSLMGSSLRVVARLVRPRPVAYRPQGSIPGKAVIPVAYIPRRFPQLISSALGSSSHPSHGSPFHQDERTSKQQEEGKAGGQAGERLSLSAPSRIALTLVSSLLSAGGAKGVSFPSAGSVSGSRFPVPVAGKDMTSARSRSHHDKQAGRGGPSPFRPSYRRAGSHRPTLLVSAPRGPVIGMAGKQARWRQSSSRLASVPSRLIVSSASPPRIG